MKQPNILVARHGFVITMILALILTGSALTGLTMAADPVPTNFRVDNGIFKLGQKEPLTRTVTVFLDGIVYDFILESEKITILDELEGSFTLIDVKKGVQTAIPTQFVDKAIERLAIRAAKRAAKHPTSKNDLKTKFFYDPKFESTQKDAATGELIFKSPWLTYRVAAKQGDIKAAKQYRRFADAYAKLNTVLNPGSKPPFARMLVNRTLAESTTLPKAVLVTQGKESDPKAARSRSEHRYEMKLTKNDKKRISDVKKSLETLKVVTLEEFQKR